MSEKFETFMARREAAARAFVTGDAEPVVALSTETGTATTPARCAMTSRQNAKASETPSDDTSAMTK